MIKKGRRKSPFHTRWLARLLAFVLLICEIGSLLPENLITVQAATYTTVTDTLNVVLSNDNQTGTVSLGTLSESSYTATSGTAGILTDFDYSSIIKAQEDYRDATAGLS